MTRSGSDYFSTYYTERLSDIQLKGCLNEVSYFYLLKSETFDTCGTTDVDTSFFTCFLFINEVFVILPGSILFYSTGGKSLRT